MTASKSRIIVSVLGITLLMVTLLGLGPNATAAPSNQRGGLFADAAIEGDIGPFVVPNTIRTRLVVPSFDQVGGMDDVPAADVLALNLFEDANFTAILDYTE